MCVCVFPYRFFSACACSYVCVCVWMYCQVSVTVGADLCYSNAVCPHWVFLWKLSLSLCILLDILESTAQNRKTQITSIVIYTHHKALLTRSCIAQEIWFHENIFLLWWLVEMQTLTLAGVTIDWPVGIRSITVIGQLTQAWGMHCSNIFPSKPSS